MDHHRRAAGACRTCQRGSRGQIGIDRRAKRGAQDPAFQGHAERAERGRGRPRMVVGIDEGGKNKGARACGGRRSGGDRGDGSAIVPQHDVFQQATVRTGEQAVCDDFGNHKSAPSPIRHSGAMQSIEPGISRFRVWCCAPSRNDGARSHPSVRRIHQLPLRARRQKFAREDFRGRRRASELITLDDDADGAGHAVILDVADADLLHLG